jgi:hypothetical protein
MEQEGQPVFVFQALGRTLSRAFDFGRTLGRTFDFGRALGRSFGRALGRSLGRSFEIHFLSVVRDSYSFGVFDPGIGQ